MEERKKRGWLIPFIIGLIMIAGGVTLIVLSVTKNVPGMGDPGWFDAETKVNGMRFGGIALVMFGIFITVSSTVTKRISNSKLFQQNNDNSSEEGESQGLVGFINNLVKPQKRICKYCGSENPQDATKCQSCGANLSSKK